MTEVNARLRAVYDLNVAEMREYSGRHEYDGVPQDLSTDGVRAGLAAVAAARAAEPALADSHDEAHLSTFEDRQSVVYDELAFHRRNPVLHLSEFDLSCYDKDYAPAASRAAARDRHLAAWPRLADAAISALDQVSAPVAASLLSGVRGLAAGIPVGTDPALREAALAAHARFVAHIENAASSGDPDPALGGPALARLMSASEGIPVDLGVLASEADAERRRLLDRLASSTARVDASRPALEVARSLVRDHPDNEGVLSAAREWTARVIDFTRERGLVPYNDGECLVGPAPESRRWAVAMISPVAPGEPDGPAWYHITPADDSWSPQEQEEWLEMFSATTLPGITAHEVAPGHFSHGLAIRQAPTPVRATLPSSSFVEGWAHYAEELMVEEGFESADPRFEIGVWLEALVRVTRLACAIGIHSAGMTVSEGASRFSADTHLSGPAALSEARRATFDPEYGRYTWGKLEILRLRERARKEWGAGFSLRRFHTAMFDLGSPVLGLLGTAVERG
jgi:Bacterial protein of unknown function (DUF885)